MMLGVSVDFGGESGGIDWESTRIVTGDTGGGGGSPIIGTDPGTGEYTWLGYNAAAGMVVALTGTLAAYESYKAGEAAFETAQDAAEAEAESAAEAIRIAEEENAQIEALARARAAASGVSGASSELYISALEESGRADIDWLEKVGEYNVKSALAEGKAAQSAARISMWGSIGSAASGAGKWLSQM